MLLDAREDAEAGKNVEHLGRAARLAQFAALEQLGVDHRLFRHPEAIGHLDDADAVEEGFVVLVVLELLPFRLVGMGEHDPLVGKGADVLGAGVVPLLRRGEKRMQDLDRRLEHLDEFEQPLRGAVQAAGIAVGVGIVLREVFELADVDLADQRRDVLVVFVARLGLGDADLTQLRGHHPDDRETREVAVELVEALGRPRRTDAGQAARGNAVSVLEKRAHALGAEETERRFEDRAHFVAGGERVNRLRFHQLLEPLGERGLAAADRPEEVEDLLALLEALGGVLEEADDALDRLFHAEEAGEGRIDLDRAVEKDAPETAVLAGVDDRRFADRGDHALGRRRIHQRVVPAGLEIGREAHRLAPLAGIGLGEQVPNLGVPAVKRFVGSSGLGLRECVRRFPAHGRPPKFDELLPKIVRIREWGRMVNDLLPMSQIGTKDGRCGDFGHVNSAGA